MGINTSHDTLGRRFFISGGAVNLTGQKEILDNLGFKGIVQILGIKIVILYGISRFEYNGILKPFNSMQGLQLHF